MKIPQQFQAAADRFGVPRTFVLAGLGFVVLLILALLIGLASSATHHSPSPQTNPLPVQAQAGPVGPASAVAVKPMSAPVPANANAGPPAASQPIAAVSLAAAMLPALQAPPAALQTGAWQIQAFALPQGQAAAPTLLGSATQQSPTASMAAVVPAPLAAYITAGTPARLAYTMYFQAPQAGQYLLAVRLAGKASASVTAALDSRADALLEASRSWNPYWPDKSPAQAASATVNLAAGLHMMTLTVDCKATTTDADAATVDLYIKPQAAAVPTALVPLWPASSPTAPASAPAVQKEPSHG
jgi:hypothetical protein